MVIVFLAVENDILCRNISYGVQEHPVDEFRFVLHCGAIFE